MALKDITTQILENAEQDRQAIEEQARQELARLKDGREQEKKQWRQQEEEKLRREQEHRKRQSRSRQAQATKLAAETARREEIDQVFTEAFNKLRGQSSEQYRRLLRGLLQELPADLVGTLEAPPERLTETKQALADSDLELTLRPEPALAGGFRVITERADYDYTLQRLLEDAREQTEEQVAEILFGPSTSSSGR